jgi:CubicO group peptidase (beta-lactamase class C family)
MKSLTFSALKLLLITALLIALVTGTAWAEFDQAQMDGWLKETYPADQPGATVIAIKNGEVVLRGAYGMANLEQEIALETDMVFRLGSITKQFTATAIMMLEQQGKLSVTDDITVHLPDYPTQGKVITIENLLTHTSGIPNYTDIPGWMETRIRNHATNEEMFEGWQALPLEFEPGERYQYSNSAYFMLGAIIEAASGMSYEAFVEEKIFAPLGMNNSYFDRSDRLIPGRVSGYRPDAEGFLNAPFLDMSQPGAAGSLASSVEDMALWDASLYTEKLLPAEAWQRMWSPFQLNNGELSAYGYGWSLGEHDNSPIIQHNGGIFGFTTSGIRMPDQQLYVAVLSNGARANPGGTAQRLVMALLGEEVDLEPVDIPLEDLADLQGVYRINDDDVRVVTVEETGIYTQRTNGRKFQVTPLGNDRFFYPGSLTQIQFHRNEDGSISHHEIFAFGSAPGRADLTDEPIPEPPEVAEIDPAVLDDYVGNYELVPGFVLRVWAEDDMMHAQATGPGQGVLEVLPRGDDVFFNSAVGAVLNFHRGDNGQVTRLVLEQGGQTLEGDRE